MRKLLAVLAILISGFLIPTSASADTVIPYGTNISGSVTWTKAASPYIVSGMGVAADGILTIEPGVVVKFDQNGGMGVAGRLIVGAPLPAELTTVTSIRDDSVGGDSNGDGSATLPVAGNWNGIYFQGAGVSTVHNAVIRYGGNLLAPLIIQNGTVVIDGTEVSDSPSALLAHDAGTLVLSTSALNRAPYGINSHAGTLELASTTFHSLLASSVLVPSTVNFINHGGNSGEGGFEISGNLTGTQTWNSDGLPYLIQSYGTAPYSSLTILPGTVVKFHQGGGFGVTGSLTVGSASEATPVTFTSIRDDGTFIPPKGDWNGVYLYATSTLYNAVFRYGGNAQGVLNNQGGVVSIVRGSISESGNVNFFQHAGTTTIDGTLIMNAQTGVMVDGGGVTIHNAKIAGNSVYGVNNISPQIVDATNNYWGAPDGPRHPIDLFDPTQGSGDQVSTNVTYKPFQVLYGVPPPPACTVDCNSNVLFLPGMMGSRLFEQSSDCGVFNNEKERWVSTFDCDHSHLSLDTNGKSIYPLYTKEGDRGVIDDTYSSNIYQSFMRSLSSWKSEGTINDYALVPYDWRLSLEDILQNGASSTGRISYATSQGFQNSYIYKKLGELADSSRTKKVTIIAHSNGGLVTKALIQKLKDTHDPLYEKIDKVIFVAVPQSGTPDAIGSLLHGTNVGPGGVVISAKRARDLLHNMPTAYNLLPTKKYIGSGIPFIEFSGFGGTSSLGKYAASIDTIPALYDYLSGGDGRTTPSYADLLHAQIANSGLLADTENVHAILDNWVPATSTEVYEIAGWGIYTPMGIKYEPNKICVVSTSTVPVQPGAPLPISCAYYEEGYKISDKLGIDGDGTVMRRSAHQMASSTSVHQYWLDLHSYNLDNFGRNHKDIFEATNLLTFLKSVVVNIPETNNHVTNSILGLSTVQKAVKYEIHSPLNLNIYDAQGHHTGVSTTTGLVELGVKGSFYYEIGDSKIIVVDATTAHTMNLDAYDSGSFTLDIEKLDGDRVAASTTFMGIPTATSTKVSLDWTSSEEIGTSTKLSVDYNGDNIVDMLLLAKTGGTVLLPNSAVIDFSSPTTTASSTGTQGLNNWYTSNALVTLTATDTGSGVATTSYSINAGAWAPYTAPIGITQEGSTTILYYSTDKAGNKEANSTLIIKIDKTAPEAAVTFDPVNQTLNVTGSDNLSSTTVITAATSSLITDKAGHTLKVLLTDLKPKAKLGRINMSITALVYDGVPTPLASTTLKYKWATTTPQLTYKMFAAYLTTSSTSTEAHYRPKKSVTIIMSTPTDLDDTDVDEACDARITKAKLTEMVVPYMQTSKGKVNTAY